MDGESGTNRNNSRYGQVDFDDDMKASEASALTDEGEARVPTNVWASFWVSVLQLFALPLFIVRLHCTVTAIGLADCRHRTSCSATSYSTRSDNDGVCTGSFLER
jgi:hypothetical protein